MLTDEQRLIQDTLRAVFRSSPLLLDNLGILVNTAEAYRRYCINYNRALLINSDPNDPELLGVRPESQHIFPETMGPEHEKLAVLEAAHLIAESWR